MNQEMLYQREEGKISWVRRAWPFWCFLAVLLLSFVPLWLEVYPQRDAAFRYAPMAEAFRDHDFVYAFHPRTGFLHTFTAGVFAWLTGCSGFLACKVSSLLFIALSAFPLFALMRRVYSRTMAEICTFIFVLASQLQHLGWSGLRDSHKMFLVMLAACAMMSLYQERKKWSSYLVLGVAAGLGIVTRGDLVLFMSLVFLWGVVLELKLKSVPWRSMIGCAAAVAVSFPAIFLNWYIAGVAVPEIRFAWLFRKVFHRYPDLPDAMLFLGIGIVGAFLAAWVLRRIIDAGFGKWLAGVCVVILAGLLTWRIISPEFYLETTVRSYIGAILKGFFPVYGVVALVGIVVRLFLKQWTREESILAGFLFGHTILVCSQIILNDCFLYVSARYLVPAVPLEFGWSVIGIIFLWEFLTNWIRGKHPTLVSAVGHIAFILTVCGFLYDYYNPVIREHLLSGLKEQQFMAAQREIADTIRQDYKGPAEFRPEVDPGLYIPKHNPAILYLKYRANKDIMVADYSRITISAYLIRARVTGNQNEADFVVERYTPRNRLPPGLVLLRKIKYGKEEYQVWKKRN